MNKKIILGFLIIGCILGIYGGYAYAASKTPVTITVAVYSLEDAYNSYNDSFPSGSDASYEKENSSGVVLNAPASFACSLTGSGTTSGSNVGNAVSTWCTHVEDGFYDINRTKLKIGTYSFHWSDTGVTTSGNGGSAVCGQTYSSRNVSYKFTFPDNKKVNLVMKSSGSITGKITYNDDASKLWKKSGSTSWYRTSNKDSYSTYNGLDIKQSKNSGMLQIASASNTGATNATVSVYVSGSAVGWTIDDGNVFAGNIPSYGQDTVNYEAPQTSSNGYASGYTVGTGLADERVSENTWEQIEILVNNFIDEIKMVSWFYYGIAFLTSVLMIIVNIIKTAGAPNNPMMKTRIYIDLGVSVLCLALLGASVVLTRLFILTCLG